jgi:hypothetical protein
MGISTPMAFAVFGLWPQDTNPPHAVALLRHCRERPSRRAAKRGDKFAPSKANPHLALPCKMPSGSSRAPYVNRRPGD